MAWKRNWIVLLLLLSRGLKADEGMWLLNDFPAERFAKAYGQPPSRQFLERARLASVRLAQGCSGSFVSPHGLVMTNHHCVAGCVKDLSSAENDLMAKGFYATAAKDEIKCPNLEANVLMDVKDVTERIREATKGKEGAAFGEALRAEKGRIESECAKGERWRCEVVTLYHGARYELYVYRRYQDIRLVFAPEEAIAFFGGDPDNFEFPRYDLDVAFVRVYEDNRPLEVKEYFRFSREGPKEGEVVFVTGHPGRTMRLLTVAQLEFLRDALYPLYLKVYAELRGMLTQFSRESPEKARIARNDLFFLENSFKAYRGMHEALLSQDFVRRKREEESSLREAFSRAPEFSQALEALDEISVAQERLRAILKEYWFLEGRGSTFSRLFNAARALVRWDQEKQKPNEDRLREFTDAALPGLKQWLFSEAPIEPELEEVKLAFWLSKIREYLGVDHPYTKIVLGRGAPEDLAHNLVIGTALFSAAERRRLWEEGVGFSEDAMILFAKRIDEVSRAVRKKYEDEIESVEDRAGQLLGQARFKALGYNTYPDATFTLRITYGTVTGYFEGERQVGAFTYVQGLFERATGKEPFALPASWLQAQRRLDMATPMNFVSTCDIIGGNSGSPVINRKGEVVGVIFDGNIHSLGGAFWFDASLNRAIAVASPAILEALEKVYFALPLVRELLGGKQPSRNTKVSRSSPGL